MLRGERLGVPGSHGMDDSGLGRWGCISRPAVSVILTGQAAFLPTRFAAERCWSGRTGLPAKQLHLKRVSGVRIPPSPPDSKCTGRRDPLHNVLETWFTQRT